MNGRSTAIGKGTTRTMIEVIERHQSTPEYLERKAPGSNTACSAGECDCWIEPDESYTEITPEMQQPLEVLESMSTTPTDRWPAVHLQPLRPGVQRVLHQLEGHISFTEPVIDWTPEELPDANYNIISDTGAMPITASRGHLLPHHAGRGVRELGGCRLLQQPR